jgi:hypothetical protein
VRVGREAPHRALERRQDLGHLHLPVGEPGEETLDRGLKFVGGVGR